MGVVHSYDYFFFFFCYYCVVVLIWGYTRCCLLKHFLFSYAIQMPATGIMMGCVYKNTVKCV